MVSTKPGSMIHDATRWSLPENQTTMPDYPFLFQLKQVKAEWLWRQFAKICSFINVDEIMQSTRISLTRPDDWHLHA